MIHTRLLIAPALLAFLAAGCRGKDASTAPELSRPAKLTLVSGDGQTATAPGGAALAPLIVRVTDPKDRPVGGVTVSWTASDAAAHLSAATSTTDGQGQAQVTWTPAEAGGVQSVTATTTTIPGARVVFQARLSVSSLSGTVAVATAPPIAFSANRAPSPATASAGFTRDEASLTRVLAAQAKPRRLIVQFKPTMVAAVRAFSAAKAEITRNQSAMQRTLSTYVGRSIVTRAEVSPAILAARVTVPDGTDMAAAIATLTSDPTIESVTVDEIVPMLGDYTATEATPLRVPAGATVGSTRTSAALTLANDPFLLNEYWHYNLVDAFRVWGTNTGSAQVLVAVVDQGVRFDHPSMASNFTTDGYNFVAAGDRLTTALPICASSGGGTSLLHEVGPGPDPTLPDDFSGISGGCLVRSTVGDHGLHVSGTIGAPGNDGVGTAGLNWNVRIRPVRVLDMTGSGSYFDIAQGILYAAGLPAVGKDSLIVQVSPGARVINMSLGGSGDNALVRSAVSAATEAGSLIIAAAGNSSTYLPFYPAAYPEVLSVAALGPDLQLTGYTNVGPNVSLAAPGGDFRNCCGGGGGVLSTTYNFVTHTPNYAYYSGTSMAAPHVTGVAALVLAANPSMTNTQLRQRLQSTAVDVGAPGRDDRYGYGVVNAYNAVNNITSSTRKSFVRVINASTGDVFRSLPVASGSYSVPSVPAGSYYVVAGEDDANDQTIGIPGRRLGWFGGAGASAVTIAAGQAATASIVIGTPFASKPNGAVASATRLFVNTYAIDYTTSVDPAAFYVVQIPKAATYVFETSGVLGTCGLGMELDTVLELFDQTQTLLGRNDNASFAGSALCSQLTATNLMPGTYYLRVMGAGAAATNGGQFRISVRDTP